MSVGIPLVVLNIPFVLPPEKPLTNRLFHFRIHKTVEYRYGKSLKNDSKLYPIRTSAHFIHHSHITCVLISRARMIAKIYLANPSTGAVNTTKYVMPNNGIKTSKAFVAFRYCFVSTLLFDRNLIISTLKTHFMIKRNFFSFSLRIPNIQFVN